MNNRKNKIFSIVRFFYNNNCDKIHIEGAKIMSENKAKKVKEIFSDYQARANIIEAEILNLDVIKKTNTLGITIKYDEYIEIKEIWYFENSY